MSLSLFHNHVLIWALLVLFSICATMPDISSITEEDFVKSIVTPLDLLEYEYAGWCGWEDLELFLDDVEYGFAYWGDITRVVIE